MNFLDRQIIKDDLSDSLGKKMKNLKIFIEVMDEVLQNTLAQLNLDTDIIDISIQTSKKGKYQ